MSWCVFVHDELKPWKAEDTLNVVNMDLSHKIIKVWEVEVNLFMADHPVGLNQSDNLSTVGILSTSKTVWQSLVKNRNN